MEATATTGPGGAGVVAAAGSEPRSSTSITQNKHASSSNVSPSTPTATASPTVSEKRQRSSSNPAVGPVRRIAEHDSLVTVRLSEPPRQLTLNTNVSTIAARRSLLANTLSPASSAASPRHLSSPSADPDEFLSPVTSIPSGITRPNLQEELDGFNDDAKTIGPTEEEDSDDEEVDWEQLQKTEDAECNKETDEDVGTAQFLTLFPIYLIY